MKRIVIHWTGSGRVPNYVDLEHYHFIVDAAGKVHNGLYKPEDNINCSDSKYARHTGGGNTGSIGLAMCGMAGFKDRNNIGEYPLTKVQCEAYFNLIANLCHKYKIDVTPDTVLTHYEFGKKNPKTSSFGKIDIIYLPPYSHVAQDDIGDYIRSKVRYYRSKIV